MAIAFDVASNSGTQTVSTFNWSHTVTGSNTILIVGVTNTGFPLRTVSGITYNSVALTKIRADTSGSSDGTELWYLIAPSTGSNSVAVTLSAASAACFAGAMSLTGVDQSSPIETAGGTGNSGSSATPSVSVTTVANNAWIVGAVGNNNQNTLITITSPGVRQYVSTQFVQSAAGFTNGPISPAAATTTNMTSANAAWAVSAASLKPFGAAASPLRFNSSLSGLGASGPFFHDRLA